MTSGRLKFGLAAKFSLLVSLPVLIASLALSYNFIRHELRQIKTAMIERGEAIAREIAHSSEYGILIEDKEILNEFIEIHINEHKKDILYIFIRNASGEILASCDEVMGNMSVEVVTDGSPAGEQKAGHHNFRVIETDLLYDITCDVVTVRERRSREDIGLLQGEHKVRPYGSDRPSGPGSRKIEKIGTVQVGLSKAGMTDSVRKAKLSAVWLTAVIIVVAILATVVLVRVMVKPIKRLAIAAGEVSRGHFDYTVEIKSKDEIGDLAGSFNKMVADLKRSREALQYRLETERIVTAISTDFINLAPDEVDSGIRHALQTIGEFVGADRSYIFLFSDDGKKIENIHKWCVGGLESRIDDLKGLAIEAFTWGMERLNQSESIHIPRVSDLPPEANAEKEILRLQGVQSVVGVPMLTYGGPSVGFLALDTVRTEKTWMEEDITLLKMVGEILVNTLERKRAEEALQYRLKIERTVAAMSTDFIDLAPDEVDSVVNYALQTIGEFTGVDRSYVFLLSDDGKKMDNTHEWCAEGIESQINNLKGLPVEVFPWWMERLKQFESIHIPRVSDLPPEASAGKILQSQGVRSLIVVPMVYGGSLGGFLGFDSVRTEKIWMEEDVTLLKMVGEIFVNALERKRTEEALQHQLEVEERITRELEEKARKLSQSNEELDTFVYNVSHDLKTPVVSLQGFSSLLMKEYEDRLDENGKMYIHRIQKNSERMVSLIDDLLELSRIGRIKGREELVNISDVISDVANELAPQLEETGTRLMVKDDMPAIRCDRTRMGQVFANLISNANKFMGEDNEDPTIQVGYDDQGGYHRFYVKDNGIGIDEEYHEKIFQIFQRLDDIQTEGTGVGLTIVKKIVESFGGDIWIDSAKGKGTTMYFTMPKADNAS